MAGRTPRLKLRRDIGRGRSRSDSNACYDRRLGRTDIKGIAFDGKP